MTGNNRKVIISLAIVALVVLNIWRWWPTSVASVVNADRSDGTFDVADFEVKAIPVDSLPPMSRDIFHAKKMEIVKRRSIAAMAPVQIMPAKSPEEMARDSAQAEFAQIQCVGISVRNGLTHAYLIFGGEPSLVSSGDKVGSRFVVEKIVPDGISLRDPETGVGGLVTVSGKR